MKVTRETEKYIDLELSTGVGFRMYEALDGSLIIHRQDGEAIFIKPMCRNEIEIRGRSDD